MSDFQKEECEEEERKGEDVQTLDRDVIVERARADGLERKAVSLERGGE